METRPKAIVLWGKEDLLVSSFGYYLASQKNWQVVGISKKESIEILDQAVKETDPDFVIIRLGEYNVTTLLPMQLLQRHPSLKVITVRLENNSMEVYSKYTRETKKATDLISVLDHTWNQRPTVMAGERI